MMPYQPRIPAPVSDEVYIVEAILDHRGRGRGTEYLVKWEGYDEPSWTWACYTNCRILIQEYHRRRLRARRAWQYGRLSPDCGPGQQPAYQPVLVSVDMPSEEAPEGERSCVVCRTNRPTHIVQPCNHAILCSDCVRPVATLKGCPKCRGEMERIAPFYLD